MHKQLVVVADDFTGANDTGVQFKKAGFKVLVMIDPLAISDVIKRCDVLVIDLETRQIPSTEAYNKNFLAATMLGENMDCIIYKKLDSTFRGNIGSEIDGLMDALKVKTTFLAAAWPVNGRTTENGEVYVHNVKLGDTEAKNDPGNPVKLSRIATIVALQSKRLCCEVPVNFCLFSDAEKKRFLIEQTNLGREIFIFDSRTEADLEAIAKTIEAFRDLPFLLVGSAGLASHLSSTKIIKNKKLTFIFAGSISKKTLDQVSYVVSEGNCKLIYIDARNLLDDNLDYDDLVAVVSSGIKEGFQRFIFTAATNKLQVTETLTFVKEKDWDQYEVSSKISIKTGLLASNLINIFNPSAIVLTGGETAINTVKALGATGIEIDQEILPGVQTGRLTGCSNNSLVVTKAGGFGEPDTFVKIFQFLNA